MRYLSVCAGIEAATMAWHSLGWEAAAFSEIEPFPRAVLAHRYPNTPLHGDFTTIEADQYGPIDLLVGGTPCQSFSVAGLRGGLDDDRGNLALEFLRLAQRTRPKWLVWENVPGVLSSNGGRDFGAILGGMVECGYGFAYRVLDAQFFGVPQRRRRVFVVGYFGDWRPAAAVLFERHSLSGHSAPRREKGQRVAGYTASSFGGYREGCGTLRADGGDYGGGTETLLADWPADIAPTLNAAFGEKQGLEDQHIRGGAGLFVPSQVIYATDGQANAAFAADKALSLTSHNEQPYIAFDTTQITSPGNYSNPKAGDPCHPLAAGADAPAVAFPIDTQNMTEGHSSGGKGFGEAEDPSFTLTKGHSHGVATASAVRRLTPVECERLQGFPDNFTAIPWRGKPADQCPDGPRYKALGNSMAVPVMRFIGKRIQQVEAALEAERKAA